MVNPVSNIDNNKIFFINRSDLIDRYDPCFFKGEFSFLRKSLIAKGFVNFGFFINSWNRGDGPREGFFTEDKDNGVYFLRVNNLKDNTIDLKDVKFINRQIHETKLKRTQVKAGNLIFAISGTKDNLGTISIIPEGIKEANLNSAIIRLDLNEEKIRNEFVCLLFDLKIIRTQVEFIGKGAAQNNLNYKELSSILVPNISVERQLLLIEVFNKAKLSSKQKESKAKELLTSIDTYILTELGITLPEKTIGLTSRIFMSLFSEVAGVRFDPLYFKNKGVIKSHLYPNNFLRLVAEINKGKSITKEKISKGNYPVIAGGQSSPYAHNEYNFEGNVITVSASGAYAGFVWYHNYKIFASDCVVLQSKNEKEISTHFIYHIMKALQGEIYKLQQGAGQPHVYARDLEKIIIPTPPPSKQNEMLKHINNIHKQIKQLQSDATEILENAKRKVEEIILG